MSGDDDAGDLTRELKAYLEAGGASLVGIADLSLPSLMPPCKLPIGISIVVSLSPQVIRGILKNRLSEYVHEYSRANDLLVTLSGDAVSWLLKAGYNAVTIPPTLRVVSVDRLAAEYPHKTAATRSGLGWIGRSALLVTREFGSAIRLVTVFTDAPLIPGTPEEISQCGECIRCRTICPGSAPKGNSWYPGLFRDAFWDSKKCFEVCNGNSSPVSGLNQNSPQVCGRCIAICPWTERYLNSTPP